MKLAKLILIITFSLFLGACASSNSGSVYKRDDARTSHTVKTGTVESVRQVKIEGTQSPIGPIAGGAIGGIAGGSVGSGRGSQIMAILGSLLGGVAGGLAEEAVTSKNALEITVKIDGGSLLAIVQEADEAFSPGERVRIVENGGTSRVTH